MLILSAGIFLHKFMKRCTDTNSVSNIEFLDSNKKDYDDFSVENVSLVRKRNGDVLFSLVANRICHRKRSSKLFVYQNVKEIFISGARMEMYLNNNISPKTSDNYSRLVDNIKNISLSFGKPAVSIKDYLNNRVADSNLDILSRIVFEDIHINIYLPENKRISIKSTNATVNADTENIVFSGDVSIVDSSERKFCSSKAVWSKKYRGIYFPEGYIVKKREHKNKAFYVMNQEGEFLKALSAVTIEYLDLIEKNENDFYPKLLKKLPPQVKIMLGLPPL